MTTTVTLPRADLSAGLGGNAAGVELVPAPKGPPPTHLRPLKRGQGRREREEQQRLERLRAEQPYLTQRQTDEYRNSFYQSLSVSILKEGYHRTFSQLFHLIAQQKAVREAAGPDSVLWNVTPLDQEKEKLVKMRDCLTEAEDADRMEDYHSTYKAYLELAIYFQDEPFDRWLSDHYYHSCLDTSSKISDDEGRTMAESHFNLGLALERGNKLADAAEHFKLFYDLTESKEWYSSSVIGGSEDGDQPVLLHSEACENLARVYGNLALQVDMQPATSVEYLLKAYEMAKESGNKKLEGSCGYQLGLGYQKFGKPDTALLFLRNFYDLAKSIDDEENLGLACEAMAKAYEIQGKSAESIKFLQEFVEVTERSKQDRLYSRACRGLGAVYNNMGKYAEAAEFFTKAFTVARTLNDMSAANMSRLQVGVAKGCQMDGAYSSHVQLSTRQSLTRTVDWKSTRTSNFNKLIEDAPTLTLASRRPPKKERQPDELQQSLSAEPTATSLMSETQPEAAEEVEPSSENPAEE